MEESCFLPHDDIYLEYTVWARQRGPSEPTRVALRGALGGPQRGRV